MRTAAWNESVSVLDRVTAVFEAFGDDEGLGVSELARRANIPKSTVSRVAADLVAQRLLDRDGDRFYLGVRLFELGQSVEQPQRLRRLALPVMTELRDVTMQSAHLAVLDGDDVVVLAVVRGEGAAHRAWRVGGRLPAHSTAIGRSILAFSPPELVQGIASRAYQDPAQLWRELSDIRRLGVASEQDQPAGQRWTAAAVLGHGASAIAAIATVGDGSGAHPDRVAPALRAAAAALGRRVAADHEG